MKKYTRLRGSHGAAKKKGTRKKRGSLISFEKEITSKFLQMLMSIKLFHWKTHSFATHEATDHLYEHLNEHVDKFVEVLLGKTQHRVMLNTKCLPLHECNDANSFKLLIERYKGYLVNLDHHPGLATMSNTDLYNIRDEILGDMNKLLYLMSFK